MSIRSPRGSAPSRIKGNLHSNHLHEYLHSQYGAPSLIGRVGFLFRIHRLHGPFPTGVSSQLKSQTQHSRAPTGQPKKCLEAQVDRLLRPRLLRLPLRCPRHPDLERFGGVP